jgi:hypothetical protein
MNGSTMDTLAAAFTIVNQDTEPTRTFDFEPLQARELEWLPLAVRFKLDRCALRVRLRHWQALDRRERASLLVCADGPAFRQLVLQLFGEDCCDGLAQAPPASFRDYLAGKGGAGPRDSSGIRTMTMSRRRMRPVNSRRCSPP